MLEGRHDRPIDLLEDSDTGRTGDHGFGPDLSEFTLDLGSRALRDERHGDHPRTEDAEPGANETKVGRAQDRDPVTRFESERDENPASLLDLGGQLPVGDAVAASDDGGAFCGMISEEVARFTAHHLGRFLARSPDDSTISVRTTNPKAQSDRRSASVSVDQQDELQRRCAKDDEQQDADHQRGTCAHRILQRGGDRAAPTC